MTWHPPTNILVLADVEEDKKKKVMVVIVTLKVRMGNNLRKPQLKPWKRKFMTTLMTQMTQML
jgi:hypothetical protein